MSSMVKILGLASLLVSLGCGGSSSGGGGSGGGGGGGGMTTGSGSCAVSTGGTLVTCTDYGAGFTASTVMQTCSSSMATYSTAACPSANRVGRCEITEMQGAVSVGDAVNFYSPETSATVMSVCSMENGLGGITTTFVPN
jgi:hypothetical protein